MPQLPRSEFYDLPNLLAHHLWLARSGRYPPLDAATGKPPPSFGQHGFTDLGQERKQIPHYRMMSRSIRFSLAELAEWRRQFHVNGGIDEG